MKQIMKDRRYHGIVFAIELMVPFVLISIYVNRILYGSSWYIFSSMLRLVFGVIILLVAPELYGRSAGEILRFDNAKTALIVGAGFLLFFLYIALTMALGSKTITGLTLDLFLTKIILQQITTGFYEELHYRFLICEGYFHGEETVKRKLFYGFFSFLIFGILHVIPGGDIYRFFLTGIIGFAFATMFLCSRNIVVPMILHTLYDIVANLDRYIEWNQSRLFLTLNSLIAVVLVIVFLVSLYMLMKGGDCLARRTNDG